MEFKLNTYSIKVKFFKSRYQEIVDTDKALLFTLEASSIYDIVDNFKKIKYRKDFMELVKENSNYHTAIIVFIENGELVNISYEDLDELRKEVK